MLWSLESLRLLGSLSLPPPELLRSELPPSDWKGSSEAKGPESSTSSGPPLLCRPYSPNRVKGVFPEVRQPDAYPRRSASTSHRIPGPYWVAQLGVVGKTRYPKPVILLVCRFSRHPRVPSGPNKQRRVREDLR